MVESVGHHIQLVPPLTPDAAAAFGGGAAGATLVAPMPSTSVKVNAREGDAVQAHQTLAVLEAVKTEQAVQASSAGRVRRVLVKQDQQVSGGEALIELDVEGK